MSQRKQDFYHTILTYTENALKGFDEEDFTEVDSLVLSAFSYLRLPEFVKDCTLDTPIVLKDLFRSEYFPQMFSQVYQASLYKKLLTAMTASPRFRNIRLSRYISLLDQDTDMQFAAITLEIRPGCYYIAFRGTDSSLTGWKEDLNLSLSKPIPAQLKASEYLLQLLYHGNTTVYIGGHSKGGNLATYAVASLVKKFPICFQQIQKIYSHDGPGFSDALSEYLEFDTIKEKVCKTIPQSSLVGQVLNQEADCQVIKSIGKGGIEQHSPFTWIIEDGHFVYLDKLEETSIFLCQTVNQWISQLNEEERQKMIDSIFSVLEKAEIEDFSTFSQDLEHQLPLVIKEALALDSDTRSFLLDLFKQLAQTGVRKVPDVIQDKTESLTSNLKTPKMFHVKHFKIKKKKHNDNVSLPTDEISSQETDK